MVTYRSRSLSSFNQRNKKKRLGIQQNLCDYKDNWYIYSRPPKIEDESKEGYNKRSQKRLEYIKNHKIVKINCEAGDAVFFLSRTGHCVAPTESNNHRLVFYISMLPKSLYLKQN